MDEATALFRARQTGHLPDHLGLDWIDMRQGFAHGRFEIEKRHWRQTAIFTPLPWSASRIPLAVMAASCRSRTAPGFTTAELKANFIGTALEGGIICEARLVHGGRTTQVWDAEVKSEATGKTIALFRCTQIVLSKPRGSQ